MNTTTEPVKKAPSRYYLLYLPSLLALLLSGNPVACYLAAWLGSFFIFYVSFTNKVKRTNAELPLSAKILKPLFLTQIIFAGYMSCSSVFYFLSQLGYDNFHKVPGFVPSPFDLSEVAAVQQYYLLGHAALTHALLFFYRSSIPSRQTIKIANWPAFMLRVTLVCTPLGMVMSRIGGLSVLGDSILGLALVGGTISFALAIPLRKTGLILLTGAVYLVQLAQTLTSGFKEPVIVSVLMLGLFLYPFYKKLVTYTFIPLLLLLFTVLPTYVATFRSQVNHSAGSEEAKAEALQKVREDLASANLAETNWDFLTNRISEIGMFVKYKESTEERGTFYGGQILAQAAIGLVPRLLWPQKPIMEELAMVRVLENGIIEDYAEVSAKPQYIVDGYLSGGIVGIWLALFFYGAVAQLCSNLAEKLFGGYLLGTVFVYTGMFRSLWRGNCFEFIFNNMFYAFVGMVALYFLFKRLGILVEEKPATEPEAEETPATVVFG